MNIKRIAALLLASTMLCGALASCKDNKAKTSKNNADNTERNYTADGELPTAADLAGVELEEAVVAQSGDAYLSIIDENWKSQYSGGDDENNPLTYDAGVVHIDKNGDYTVSVNADTKGFRYRSTGDPDKECKPTGISFAAVVINDAENVLPGAVITVKSVKVDGRDIELKKKSYTNTESGDIRSNIFNEWVENVDVKIANASASPTPDHMEEAIAGLIAISKIRVTAKILMATNEINRTSCGQFGVNQLFPVFCTIGIATQSAHIGIVAQRVLQCGQQRAFLCT